MTTYIYGENSPGNYHKLQCLSKYMRFIPKIENKRSILEINELSGFVETIIINEEYGLFMPQSKEYLVTNNVIREFRKNNNKKTTYCFLFTILVKIGLLFSVTFKKMYGSLIYE